MSDQLINGDWKIRIHETFYFLLYFYPFLPNQTQDKQDKSEQTKFRI